MDFIYAVIKNRLSSEVEKIEGPFASVSDAMYVEDRVDESRYVVEYYMVNAVGVQ